MAGRLRIGIVTGEYPPHEGGVGDFSRLLAAALAAGGHEVHVITHQAAQADPAINLHPMVRDWSFGALWWIRRLADSIPLDIVNIQYQAAAYRMTLPIHCLPQLVKVPTVVTFHDLRVPYLFPKAGALRRRAIHYLARSARGVIVTNSEDRIQLEHVIGAGRLIDIPIGSNIAPARHHTGSRSFADSRRFGLKDSAPVVGYFGFLNVSKGGETLLKALARLKDYQLLMIGGRTGTSDSTNPAFAAKLDALAAGLGLGDRVSRTGYLAPAETTQAFLACDLMAMPYDDGASLRRGSLMACLAHGMPTISTQPSQATPELGDGQNIYLVPPGDPLRLAEAIQQVTQDAGLRARLSIGALKLAEQYSWDRIALRTAVFFEAIRPAAAPGKPPA